MKKATVHVDCCRECPFADKVKWDGYNSFFCNILDKTVGPLTIDENCPLEDI